MLRIEATIRSDKQIPFSITGTGIDRVSPKAKSHHAGSVRDVAACELDLSGYELVVACACFLGAAKLLWWAFSSGVRQYLGSLHRITRIVRLGVSLATTEDCREQPKVADGASDLLKDIFGKDKKPSRFINGVASLPLGTPVALDLIFEVT
jgi:hypothetical protein